ncbi:MAG TPA: electron transfer flavoprotein subunit alpha/FixB family protein [Thermogutta sp.]|nr:electron transfer flavoprotein subunit alpha/FixB family protein [Thermogutta sp.]
MIRRIVVPVEVYRGHITEATREALVAARTVGNGVGEVVAYVYGEPPAEATDVLELADRIIVLEDGQVGTPVAMAQAKLLRERIASSDVDLVLVGSSSWGWDVAPLLAGFLSAPLVANCQVIQHAEDVLKATCRICAGKLLVDVEITNKPTVILLLPGSYAHREVQPGKGVMERERVPASDWDARVEFKGWLEPEREDIDITQEEILVAVGRGIGQQENLELVEDLAKTLGGAVCGSRPVVDQGWLPPTRQVGKSGMIVKPKLYLAIGISGAPEHVEGMKDAELIVAINRDEQAPIFDVAHYGIAADLFDVIPALKEALVARRQEA